MRMMIAMNWTRLSDDLLERSSVFVDPEGNVTISVAQYKTIMAEAGWKQRG